MNSKEIIEALQSDNAAKDERIKELEAELAKHKEAFKYIDGQLYTLVYTEGAVKRCRSHLMKAVTKTKQHLPITLPAEGIAKEDK